MVSDSRGLAMNVGGAMLLAFLANGFAYWINPAEEVRAPVAAFDPPGYVVGMVWVGLFAGLGAARWLVLRRSGRGDANWIAALLLFCAAYPVYTGGLRSLGIGLAGNVVTGLVAVWIAVRVLSRSRLAAGLVGAVTVWVCFASVLTVLQMKAGGVR